MTDTPSSPTRALDRAAVSDVVAEADRLQSDAAGFADLLTADAVVVNFGGRRVRGRSALRAAMAEALASPLADVTTRQVVDHVTFVRPDVAIVEATKHVHDGRDGRDGDAPAFAPTGEVTFVMVRDEGRWRIASVQTTPVAA